MRKTSEAKAVTTCATAAEIRPTPKAEVIEMRAFAGDVARRRDAAATCN